MGNCRIFGARTHMRNVHTFYFIQRKLLNSTLANIKSNGNIKCKIIVYLKANKVHCMWKLFKLYLKDPIEEQSLR